MLKAFWTQFVDVLNARLPTLDAVAFGIGGALAIILLIT